MFKSFKKEQAPDIRAMRYHYHLRTTTFIPYYNYHPKQGFTRLPPLPAFRNRVLTLSLSIAALSMAWLLNQPSNASYQPTLSLFDGNIAISPKPNPDFILQTPPKSSHITEPRTSNINYNTHTSPLLHPKPQTFQASKISHNLNASLPIAGNQHNLQQVLNSAATLVVNDKTDKDTAKPEGLLQLRVQPGDNLSLIFDRYGLNRKQLHKFLSIKKHRKSLRQLHLGQKIEIQHQENGDIEAFRLSLDARHDLLISKPDEQEKFLATVLDKPITIETVTRTVVIQNSLVSDARKAGLPYKLTFQLADIFSWDVDFALGLQKGDYFTVLYEQHFSSEGENIGFGHILAAEIHNKDKVYQAVRYVSKDNAAHYYNAKGQVMEKTFLRSPVKAGYISSKFNLKRRHPVLNTIRAHKGVDYAAPRGTPIYATANGTIKFKGYRNGYGKTVSLEHGEGYETLYGHMSRYAKHLKKGKRIKQGELIGYIGSTGLASGPHLHYEFHKNGKVKNPLTIKLPATLSQVAASERHLFKQQAQTLLAQLAESTKVASK